MTQNNPDVPEKPEEVPSEVEVDPGKDREEINLDPNRKSGEEKE